MLRIVFQGEMNTDKKRSKETSRIRKEEKKVNSCTKSIKR